MDGRSIQQPSATRNEGLTKEFLFPHGNLTRPPMECHATLNQLVFRELPAGDERPSRVHEYMWAGNKCNDRKVPISTNTFGRSTGGKGVLGGAQNSQCTTYKVRKINQVMCWFLQSTGS